MKYFITGVLAIVTFAASAQISAGPKIGLGLGQIKSKNLQENLEIQNQRDADILTWDVKNRPGFFFGLGGFFQYDINDKFSVLAELTYNRLNSRINMYYEENDVDGGGSGDIINIDSRARINTSFFSLPLLAKYNLSDTGPFFMAGFRVNFMGTPKIQSEETRERTTYANGAVIGQSVETRSVSADLHSFGSPRMDFVLGGGTVFEVNGRKLFLDLRYNHPLSRSEMYTTNISFDDIAYKNNEHFSLWGKTDAELEVPGVQLDDFRMGFLEISASYVLFSK